MRVMLIAIVIGELETEAKDLDRGELKELGIGGKIETVQTTILLGVDENTLKFPGELRDSKRTTATAAA